MFGRVVVLGVVIDVVVVFAVVVGVGVGVGVGVICRRTITKKYIFSVNLEKISVLKIFWLLFLCWLVLAHLKDEFLFQLSDFFNPEVNWRIFYSNEGP